MVHGRTTRSNKLSLNFLRVRRSNTVVSHVLESGPVLRPCHGWSQPTVWSGSHVTGGFVSVGQLRAPARASDDTSSRRPSARAGPLVHAPTLPPCLHHMYIQLDASSSLALERQSHWMVHYKQTLAKVQLRVCASRVRPGYPCTLAARSSARKEDVASVYSHTGWFTINKYSHSVC